MKSDQFNKAVAISKMVIHRLFRPCGVITEPEAQRAICFAYILLRKTRTRKFINNAGFLQCRNWVVIEKECEILVVS